VSAAYSSVDISGYCRQIETYLCQKNDGHLVRVVGPSFDIVSGWAERGVPLKVALRGIDRYFERYYRNGPRRRPVKIDFCDADVLDVFDEWKRAIGQPSAASHQTSAVGHQSSLRTHPSLPAHLERVVLRLTSARVRGTLGPAFDELIDRVARELDAARAKAGGLRGEARQTLIDRLAVLDAELLERAQADVDAATRVAIEQEAEEELSGFRAGMSAEAFGRARAAATARLVREQFGLPTIAFL
jgi:hypothetical protein